MVLLLWRIVLASRRHPGTMPRPMALLSALHFELTRQALGTTQAELGKTFGVSRRTAQRWASRGTVLLEHQMLDLVRRVHPRHAQLATVLAATMGSTLEGLGVVKQPPPPPPPPPPAGIVDAVVCAAAAEAMDMTLRDVRLGLYAAFSRAQEIGLSVDVVVRALQSKLPPPEPTVTEPTASPASPGRGSAARR